MINGQVLPNHVTNRRVIEALAATPREAFVPAALRGVAYTDGSLLVGAGRSMAPAMVVGRMLQAADLQDGDIVLNVGCGTGYTMAVMGCLVGTVIGLECDKAMVDSAEKQLRDLDVCNTAIIRVDDLRKGYAQQGPYDVIFINGSIPAVPEALVAQLKPGGRLLAVIDDGKSASRAVRLTAGRDGKVSTQVLFDTALPLLKGFETKEGFVF